MRKIEGDNTNLTVTSGGAINLTATTRCMLYLANVGIHIWSLVKKFEGDNTNLTVTSGGAINLTATTDVCCTGQCRNYIWHWREN